MSKDEDMLGHLLHQEYPHYRIIPQHTIKYKKRTLFVDYYIPALRLAFEYDGAAHFEDIPFFYKTHFDFKDAVYRDGLKEQWCSENGVTLIRINHTEKLDIHLLRQKLKTSTHNGERPSPLLDKG